MDFLRKNLHSVLLIVAALLLVGSAANAILSSGSLPAEFSPPPANFPKAAFEESEEVKELAGESARLLELDKAKWTAGESTLFVSRVYLLRDGALVDIEESSTELFPGISNSWILEHNLEYRDARLAESDPDGDGFTVLEEFKGGTSPVDPASKPALWSKLRVKSFEKIPFRIKFMGSPSVQPGDPFAPDTLFSINTIDYSSPTQFLKVNDKIKGTELTIVRAESKKAKNSLGSDVDVSELFLKDQSTGDEITLVANKEVDSPYSFVIFAYPITGEDIRVEKGKTFSLAPNGEEYKLVDVDEAGAVIESVSVDGQRHTVPPL